MGLEQDIAPGLAVAFLGMALWREMIWHRRHSSWCQGEGVVEGFRASFGCGPSYPVIGYEAGGIHRTFVSSVCLYNPDLGEIVDILFDPKSDSAVMLTMRHRWMLTGLCGVSFLVMSAVAYMSR